MPRQGDRVSDNRKGELPEHAGREAAAGGHVRLVSGKDEEAELFTAEELPAGLLHLYPADHARELARAWTEDGVASGASQPPREHAYHEAGGFFFIAMARGVGISTRFAPFVVLDSALTVRLSLGM